MAETSRYRPNPSEALRMECVTMATEAVMATGGCLDLIETATAIHDFVKGKRRKAEIKAALASENVLPWPRSPRAS